MNGTIESGGSVASASDPGVAAYVAPFAVFMLIGAAESMVDAAWYPYFSCAKLAITAAVLWWARRAFPPIEFHGVPLGMAAGIVGVVVWIAAAPWTQQRLFGNILPYWLLGAARAAFNPWETIEHPAARTIFLAARLAGLVVVVPLMEELFWRGFLVRYLIDPNFQSVPFGRLTLGSFSLTTLFFAAVHPEFAAALLWGALINLIYWRTCNLWSCIAMHATTNALLGAFILAAGRFDFW